MKVGDKFLSERLVKIKKGTQCLGVQLGHHVPGGCKYGNLALQAGEVSDETLKYGYGF
jgi:hypothetical protein